MQTYPVDIDPKQVVRWLIAERQASPSALRVTARRSTEMREIPARKEIHLGDQDREDFSEIATIATLEIAPVHVSDGWLLTIVVEDEAGPRVPDKRTTTEEEEISLDAFYDEFIRAGRGSANITAEVEGPVGKAHMTRLLHSIETNRHSPGDGRSKG